MGKAIIRREAKLRTECAARYPSLPVSMWTSAASLADLVASFPTLEVEMVTGRALLDTDFEFRGGVQHRLSGGIPRTRTGEPSPSRSSEQLV